MLWLALHTGGRNVLKITEGLLQGAGALAEAVIDVTLDILAGRECENGTAYERKNGIFKHIGFPLSYGTLAGEAEPIKPD